MVPGLVIRGEEWEITLRARLDFLSPSAAALFGGMIACGVKCSEKHVWIRTWSVAK